MPTALVVGQTLILSFLGNGHSWKDLIQNVVYDVKVQNSNFKFEGTKSNWPKVKGYICNLILKRQKIIVAQYISNQLSIEIFPKI